MTPVVAHCKLLWRWKDSCELQQAGKRGDELLFLKKPSSLSGKCCQPSEMTHLHLPPFPFSKVRLWLEGQWAFQKVETGLLYAGVSQNWCYLFWGLHNEDYNILGSIFFSPYSGKLPHVIGAPYCSFADLQSCSLYIPDSSFHPFFPFSQYIPNITP